MRTSQRLAVTTLGMLVVLGWAGCGPGTDEGSSRSPTITPAQQATFQATVGAAPPAPQSFEVRVPNSVSARVSIAGVDYPAGQPAGWVVASLSSPITPAILSVQVAHASLAIGTYSATIRIKGPDPDATPVPVVLTVAAPPTNPLIGLNPSSLLFSGTAGGANPTAQAVQVSNSGTGALTGLALGTISYGAGPSGWISASLNGTTAPATVTVQPMTSGLSAGTTYTASIPVTAAGVGNSPQTIQVSFAVSQAPTIVLTPGTVTFTDSLGSGLPAPAQVQVTNGGSGALPLSIGAVAYGAGATNWLSATLGSATAPTAVTLQVLTALAAGQYTATVPVVGTGSANSPQNISVTLNVVGPDLVPMALTGPGTATIGQSVVVSITEANLGTLPVGAGWPAEIRLSQDQTCSSTAIDPAALVYTGAALAASGSLTSNRTVTIPGSVTAGVWFWCAILDAAGGVVPESNEGNNAVIGNQIVLAEPLPDIVPTALAGPSAVAGGQVVTVSITESNVGASTVPAGWPAEIRLSQDQACTSSAQDPRVCWSWSPGLLAHPSAAAAA
ncbi:MAG: hypothetical protein IPG75_19775 [Gemmatimonadetes bacterium]|nr:hypothetical protein [Gemmatimonadota bacterium]